MENEREPRTETLGHVAMRSPAALTEAFARFAGGPGQAPRPLPLQRATFTIGIEACVPGVFAEDFELTIQAITAAQELQAARAAGGDMVAMAFEMARASVVGFNGAPIPPGVDEWLWGALGTGGRQIVTGVFAKLTGAEEAQGKALATLRVH